MEQNAFNIELELGTLNLVKLLLLLNIGARFMRDNFRKRWLKYSGYEWDATSEFIEEDMGFLIDECKNLKIRSPDVDHWDITPLTDILSKPQFANHKEQIPFALTIKDVRNKVQHSPDIKINNSDFIDYWNRTKEALDYFGESEEEISKIKAVTKFSELEPESNRKILDKIIMDQIDRLMLEAEISSMDSKYDKAVGLLTKAIEMASPGGNVTANLYCLRSSQHIKWSRSATICTKTGINSEIAADLAVRDAKQAKTINPISSRVYRALGKAYQNANKPAKGQKAFEWAYSLSPGDEDLVIARDQCKMQQGIESRYEHYNHQQNICSVEDVQNQIKLGIGIDVDKRVIEAAVKSCENSSKNVPGHADVMRAHKLYFRDDGEEVDLSEVARLYSKAASLGNIEGKYHLAVITKKGGKGVKQDFIASVKLLHDVVKSAPAAPSENDIITLGRAELALGLAYMEGVGVPQNFKEAANWYRKGADHGCMGSQHNLGILYSEGKGVDKNLKKACELWTSNVSKQRCVLSMVALSKHYLQHGRDPKAAKHWWDEAVRYKYLPAEWEQEDFYKNLEKVQVENDKIEPDIQAWELSKGLKALDLTFRARIDRMESSTSPAQYQNRQELTNIVFLFIYSLMTTTRQAGNLRCHIKLNTH